MINEPGGADAGTPNSVPSARFIKRGLGSCSPLTTPVELGELHLGWYYNWRPLPKIGPVDGVEFVPMFWSTPDVTPANLAAVDQSGATHVLGFNEPDMEGQSNMTPEQCLALWPQLMTLRQLLGSPAPAQAKWLEKFMPEAKRLGLRVDFVCIHRYPDISNPAAVEEVEGLIDETYRKYGLPIWLTESGAADVSAWRQRQVSTPTSAHAEDYLTKLLAMLERHPNVERYAWFADRVGNEYGLGTIFDPAASELTPMGKIYRDGG
jgi:putative glycosyl hydrolase